MSAASFPVSPAWELPPPATVRFFEGNDTAGSHAHPEIELTCVRSGRVSVLVGSRMESLAEGSVFLIGSEITHTVLQSPDETPELLVIHFNADFLADLSHLLNDFQPRSADRNSRQGPLPFLNVPGVIWRDCQTGIIPEMFRLQHARGIDRLISTVRILAALARQKQHLVLTPMHPGQAVTKERIEEKLRKVFDYTEQHYRETITLAQVSALVNFTVTSFCRYFKKCTGKNYYHYLNEVRIEHACLLLMEDTTRSIEEVCYTVGYSSPSTFYKYFKKLLHISPREYQDKTGNRKERSFLAEAAGL